MVLSGDDWLRWRLGRVSAIGALLLLAAWLWGIASGFAIWRGFFWFVVVAFLVLVALMVLFQFNINSYFKGSE